MTGALRTDLRSQAPNLSKAVDELSELWLGKLLAKIRSGIPVEFRPKQVNDPIWGTIELLPWEVALLDTPLLQRMRGVRQLGLAHLVFPGACHGRLEHILGVVGAIEETSRTLMRQIERWNRNNKQQTIPTISEGDLRMVRLAGLLHDIGHGPFSHALEPVLETVSPLGVSDEGSASWRHELRHLRLLLADKYQLNEKPPSASEAMAVMIILSESMHEVLSSDKVITNRTETAAVMGETIIASIIGAVDGPGASHLSSLVSSQIDADKLDYLSRDAHHAGLEIGFDTDRLLSRLEVLRVRQDNLDGTAIEIRERAAACEKDGSTLLQIGIAASGFGSFEQMLIGRTFLYDRLYHHHKVRAAEAMAQRLMMVAERDRKRRFELPEIFATVDDETMLRIFAGDVTHPGIEVGSPAAAGLARSILDRDLLHRAFAFRGRFIALPPGVDPDSIEQNQNTLWGRVVKELDGLKPRYELGMEIHQLAVQCARTIRDAGIDPDTMEHYVQTLEAIGPEQVIVDLPSIKTEGIRILARYPNGAIRVPEFSFNPQKWADAYDLQKRTGYVFCPREVAPIIGLAAKIVFLGRFGVTMSNEADGYIKATPSSPKWLSQLVATALIDDDAFALLTSKRHSLISIRAEDIKVPQAWLGDDADLAIRLSVQLQKHLRGGLTSEHLHALGRVLQTMFNYVDMWFASDRVTADLASEKTLQDDLRDALIMGGLKVTEGSKLNGGLLDLFVEDAIVVENKFHDNPIPPERVAAAAGMQGRRYAVSLNSQVVIVVAGHRTTKGTFPSKHQCVSVRPIAVSDVNKVEIRFNLPYGAVRPSRESAAMPGPTA